MRFNWIRYIIFFIFLVLLQVWVFNQIHLFGFATPLLYVYFILKLPSKTSRNKVLLISFLLGFVIDSFSYTLGFNTLACVIMGFLRFYFVRLFAPRDMTDSFIPSMETFGSGLFLRYSGILVFIHHVVYYISESLHFMDPLSLVYRIGGSFILTMLLIFASERMKYEFLKK